MPFKVCHFRRNILVIEFTPPIGTYSDLVRDSRNLQQQVDTFRDNIPGNVWNLYDFSDVPIQFEQLVLMLNDHHRKAAEQHSDSEIWIGLIISDKSVANELGSFLRHYQMKDCIFGCFEEAINYVYEKVDAEALLATG